MNTKQFLALITLILGLNTTILAQGASCDSVNIDITSKFRYLGTWDENGRPNNLMENDDEVSQALLAYVNEIAPEGEDLHESSPQYFSEETQLNTVVTKKSDIYLTFVHEGAGWKNTLGFYTYPQGNAPQTVEDIDSLTFIFPNVSKEGSVLKAGDKIHLGNFEAGTVIGYFLMAQGWSGSEACLSTKSHFVFTDKHLNTYTTPEFQQQTILLNYKQENLLLLGIEDIMRPAGDQDFNDAVFYLTSDPVAIDTTDVPEIATAMISGEEEICQGESAKINIALTGMAPWTVIYTNGVDTVTVTDITSPTHQFNTTESGTYVLLDALDALGRGIISGEATIVSLAPTASFITENQLVCPGASVEVQIAVEGATSLIYGNGSENVSIDNITQDTITIEGIAPFNYELVQATNESCTTELSTSFSATAFSVPSAGVSSVQCENENLAVLTIAIVGGNAPFQLSYEYNGSLYDTTLNTTSLELDITQNGTFSFVSVSDINCDGVTTDEVLTIDCLDYSELSSLMVAPSSCRGEELSLGLSISELLDIETVQWSTNGQGSIVEPDSEVTIYIPSANEVGMIQFTAIVTIDGKSFTVDGEVEINELPDAGFMYSPEIVYTEDEVILTADAQGMDTYTWWIDGTELQGSQVSYTFMEAGVYEVVLIVNDGNCETESTQEIEVLLKNAIFVPNVFNPTATHPESRIVKVYGNNILEDGFSFEIYNRWGSQVYTTRSFVDANQNGWNGIDQSNNEDQSLATFSYLLKGEFEDGTKINQTGTITLVK